MKKILIATSLYLSACGSSNHLASKTSNVLPAKQIERQNEYKRDLARFTFQPERNFDVLSYSLDGTLDVSANVFTAKNTIQIKAKSTLSEIELDSKNLIIRNIISNEKTLNFSTTEKKLFILFAQEIQKDSILSLTIEYSTKPNLGLHFYDGNRGDPVKSKIVYTDSEPELASSWMPCHDSPADRAKFKISLTIPDNYNLVSNGVLISEVKNSDNSHTITWNTEIPIPTYLMAFASGELEMHSSFASNKLPISVWSRKNLPVDFSSILKTTTHQISNISEKLGPYPFEKYAVVLIPEFASSGMENASITFNEETRSSIGNVDRDLTLMAHELAHHWFGDLMTIENWDDLWIKEGMANLIEADFHEHTGILNGNYFEPNDGEAARDPALPAESKYNSGPYDRAAWIYTQVRHVLGEKKFWKRLRKILNNHRFSAINTDEFINSFSQDLTIEQINWFHTAVLLHDMPKAKVENGSVSFTDPENSFLVPFSILQNQDKNYMVLDTLNIHPKIDFFITEEEKLNAHKILATQLQPKNKTDKTLFANLDSAVQEEAIELIESPVESSTLNSNVAKLLNINLACKTGSPKNTIDKMIHDLEFDQLPSSYHLNECDDLYLQNILKDFSQFNEIEIIKSAIFPLNANIESWINLFKTAQSARIKILAAKILDNYKAISESQYKLIEQEIASTAITRELDRLFTLIDTKDQSKSIPSFANVFMDEKIQDTYKKEMFCNVFKMSKRLNADNEWGNLINLIKLSPQDPLNTGVNNPEIFCTTL